MKDQFLEIDVRLLLLRYGRRRVLSALAKLGQQSLDELEHQLRAVEQQPKGDRSDKPKQSLVDVAAAECDERPDIAEAVQAIAVDFESRRFLPHLRDVRRFLDRIGASQGTLKTRSAAGPTLIRALSKMTREEIVELVTKDRSPRESDYSLLSRAIMGTPIRSRDQE